MSRGHFLVYCVIARVDGQPIGANDQAAQKILSDVIELHLRGAVLDKRAAAGSRPTASRAPDGRPGRRHQARPGGVAPRSGRRGERSRRVTSARWAYSAGSSG